MAMCLESTANKSIEQRIAESAEAANNPYYPFNSESELKHAETELENELASVDCLDLDKLFPKERTNETQS